MAYTTIDDPTAYFQANLHNGDGGTGQTLTFDGNSDLQLDFHWARCRSEAGREWQVIDTVRGITKGLTTVTTATEYTEAKYVTAIGSDGYSIGQNNDNNKANETYVSYNWKTGTSVSGNTTGSGTAKAYSGSVNTTPGFSIIKYVGNGTEGHTIPHHLGAIPQMLIIKNLSATTSWVVYHHKNTSAPATDILRLDTTAATADDASMFNDTVPTSTVFTLGSTSSCNSNGASYVCYAFSEKQLYSKFGSYEGNNNANGTFVYTGFSVGWVMIKNIDTSGTAWVIQDSKRSSSGGGNSADKRLRANATNAEETDSAVDLLSNGFKIRSTGSFTSDANTFIYMAFAENPFVTSTDNGSIPATAR